MKRWNAPTRLTLTTRSRLETFASVSRTQSDEETYDMSLPGVPDDFEELIPCSACPDGYVWTSNGPTAAACPVCKGYAALKRNGSPCDAALAGEKP